MHYTMLEDSSVMDRVDIIPNPVVPLLRKPAAASLNSLVNLLRDNPMTQFSFR